MKELVAPKNLRIDFQPSPKQYILWQNLQPDFCPECGGNLEQRLIGHDKNNNPQYKPVCVKCENKDIPQMTLAGGAAGGGKSYLGSVWLVSSCIRFPDIRAVVARKTLKSLKESTWNTIKTVIKSWGLKQNVHYKINNLEGTLTFWNDSVILMKEMVDLPSDPNFERFGSSEYTIAFIDEVSEISERAVEVLFSRLRWNVHETFKVPKLLMSTNPCITWVRSRFVQDEDGQPVKCKEGERYSPFSIFDNPNIAFRQTYEAALNKIRDRATRERLLYGNWDFVDSNKLACYWNFDGEIHLASNLKERFYDPCKPITAIWDFNVMPYMSVLTAQVDYEAKTFYIFDEILGKPEDKLNNTPALSRFLREKFLQEGHVGGLIITGDPSGASRSTQTEDGVNNYTIVSNNIAPPGFNELKPKTKLLSKQPAQVVRLEFINAMFEGYKGWNIQIDLRCRKLTEDLIYQKKNPDGTKSKHKIYDANTGSRYEKYGHLSDCLDYGICLLLEDIWNKYKNPTPQSTKVVTCSSGEEAYSNFSY